MVDILPHQTSHVQKFLANSWFIAFMSKFGPNPPMMSTITAATFRKHRGTTPSLSYNKKMAIPLFIWKVFLLIHADTNSPTSAIY